RRVVAAGETQRALLVGDRGAVVTGRTSGVVQVPSVSGDGLRRVVEHARQVYVVGATDEETAALAHRVRGLATTAQQPTTVVLSDRDVAGHWATHAPETVVCRPTRTATATLRLAPPFLDHAMVPPPVVIGDGPVAAELARAIVTGWQQPGERLRVHCLGGDGDWVDEAATGIEERADLVWSPLRANVGGAPRAVLELVRRWPERDPRFTHEGARVYVAYPETSRTVPVAAAIARRVPAVEVISVVDDADTWSDTLGEGHTLRMLSAQELLTDPATLRLTPADLLAEALVADAARWPDDLPGALGVVVDGDRTARLAAQPAPVRGAVRAGAGGRGEPFAARAHGRGGGTTGSGARRRPGGRRGYRRDLRGRGHRARQRVPGRGPDARAEPRRAHADRGGAGAAAARRRAADRPGGRGDRPPSGRRAADATARAGRPAAGARRARRAGAGPPGRRARAAHRRGGAHARPRGPPRLPAHVRRHGQRDPVRRRRTHVGGAVRRRPALQRRAGHRHPGQARRARAHLAPDGRAAALPVQRRGDRAARRARAPPLGALPAP